jgi:hypothetical protein
MIPTAQEMFRGYRQATYEVWQVQPFRMERRWPLPELSRTVEPLTRTSWLTNLVPCAT